MNRLSDIQKHIERKSIREEKSMAGKKKRVEFRILAPEAETSMQKLKAKMDAWRTPRSTRSKQRPLLLEHPTVSLANTSNMNIIA